MALPIAARLTPVLMLGLFAASIAAAVATTQVTSPGRTSADPRLAAIDAAVAKHNAALEHKQDQLDGMKREFDAIRARTPPSEGKGGVVSRSDLLEGVVSAVDNKVDIYVLSIGAKDGVQIGMKFEVVRDSKAIGTIVIDKVFPIYSSASREPGSAMLGVVPGDSCTARRPWTPK